MANTCIKFIESTLKFDAPSLISVTSLLPVISTIFEQWIYVSCVFGIEVFVAEIIRDVSRPCYFCKSTYVRE
jgi:hypothetical protein